MSKHYISCARCDKYIVIKTSNDCYSSEIDGQLVCRECWQKEQPKYLTDKIADLEAKLAELREQITILDEENSKTFMKSVNAWRENAELKQQLAEKEQKLKEYELVIRLNVPLIKQLEEQIGNHSQNKISFAVEQLNQAKGKIQHNILFVDCDDYVNVIEEIDNQIKQIKEGK